MALINEYRNEQRAMRRLIANIMWHMRGSVSREDAWTLCHEEREDILALIAERHEIMKTTGMPLL